jgi:hypothetical protein
MIFPALLQMRAAGKEKQEAIINMPYDEETKVFDVAKPSKSYPDASSKPIIVGHRPQINDPMMKEDTLPVPGVEAATGSKPIHVAMDNDEPHEILAHPAQPDSPSIEPEAPSDFSERFSDHHQDIQHSAEENTERFHNHNVSDSHDGDTLTLSRIWIRTNNTWDKSMVRAILHCTL